MPYLGSTPNASFSSRTKQDFTANGSTTAFTLSSAVASANDIEVFVGNVRQEPTDAYTVNGTTLTMSEAPATGLNFYVVFKGLEENSVVPADGTISAVKIANNAINLSGSKVTGTLPATQLPSGTMLQVLQAVKTDTFSTTSGTFVQVPNLTVTITPSSASNKILVTGSIALAANYYAWHCGLFQDGTEIGKADAASNRPLSFFNGIDNQTDQASHGKASYITRELLVSPNTTSAVTFDVRAARRFDNQGSPVTYINRTHPDRDTSTYDMRFISTLTVREISG